MSLVTKKNVLRFSVLSIAFALTTSQAFGDLIPKDFTILNIFQEDGMFLAEVKTSQGVYTISPTTQVVDDEGEILEVSSIQKDRVVLLSYETQFDGRKSPRFQDILFKSAKKSAKSGAESGLKVNSQYLTLANNQLRLTAIRKSQKGLEAVFEDKTKKVYTFAKGEKAFNGDLEAIAVSPRQVTLKETTREKGLGITTRTITIQLVRK